MDAALEDDFLACQGHASADALLTPEPGGALAAVQGALAAITMHAAIKTQGFTALGLAFGRLVGSTALSEEYKKQQSYA